MFQEKQGTAEKAIQKVLPITQQNFKLSEKNGNGRINPLPQREVTFGHNCHCVKSLYKSNYKLPEVTNPIHTNN